MKHISGKTVRKTLLLAACDVSAFLFSWLVTVLVMPKESTVPLAGSWQWLLASLFFMLVFFAVFGLYKMSLSSASVGDGLRILLAVSAFAVAGTVITYIPVFLIARRVLPFLFVFFLDIVFFSRFSVRFLHAIRYYLLARGAYERVMVVGGGESGSMMIREMRSSDKLNLRPVCVIDDDPHKFRTSISGIPVVGGRAAITAMAKKYNVQRILIAIPSAPRSLTRELCEICTATGCRVQILPGVYQLINGTATLSQMKDVSISDLLGRAQVEVNSAEVFGYIENKVILVTGGGGSIGSELCRQIAAHKPKKLVIFDIYENNAYDIQMELSRTYPDLDMTALIGSVRDEARVRSVFETERPQIVFHAAAHKHVPLMEVSPHEAIKNNVFGTLNVVRAADEYGADRFVMISSDKAVNPTNVMGASKRICEMIVQTYGRKAKHTEYVAVRFGNVLGSNGSVIPLFKKQIAAGGPVTVTHKDIIRYFMTIPEAVALVLQAGAYAKGGQIFVLDMGEPVKILTLAENLIRLSGYEPYTDIPIVFTGLRPGEKLYEELLMDEEGMKDTANASIHIGRPIPIDEAELFSCLDDFRAKLAEDDSDIHPLIHRLIPTYRWLGAGGVPLDEASAKKDE